MSYQTCQCGDQRCEKLYAAIMDKASDGDVWKERPFWFKCNADHTSLKTWLVAMSAAHHMPGIRHHLLSGKHLGPLVHVSCTGGSTRKTPNLGQDFGTRFSVVTNRPLQSQIEIGRRRSEDEDRGRKTPRIEALHSFPSPFT
jgi:hypothetical protein